MADPGPSVKKSCAGSARPGPNRSSNVPSPANVALPRGLLIAIEAVAILPSA
jgi:hypothetical protein